MGKVVIESAKLCDCSYCCIYSFYNSDNIFNLPIARCCKGHQPKGYVSISYNSNVRRVVCPYCKLIVDVNGDNKV